MHGLNFDFGDTIGFFYFYGNELKRDSAFLADVTMTNGGVFKEYESILDVFEVRGRRKIVYACQAHNVLLSRMVLTEKIILPWHRY